MLLCMNGTIQEGSMPVLTDFLLNFMGAARFTGTGEDGCWSDSYGDMALYPGDTIAYITDAYNLVIMDFSIFAPLLTETYKENSYISLGEYAALHGRSREMIKDFCQKGRIIGAQKKANRWLIPKDAPYPAMPKHRK